MQLYKQNPLEKNFHFHYLPKLYIGFKGSSTHLQRAANLHQNSSSDGFWPQKNTCEVLAPSTAQFRNKKQKSCNLDFSFVFLRAVFLMR